MGLSIRNPYGGDMLSLLIGCIVEVREITENEYPFLTELGPGTSVMNHEMGEVMDSVDFVALCMLVEQKVFEDTGKTVQILSSKVFSRRHSPFATVESFTAYLEDLCASS